MKKNGELIWQGKEEASHTSPVIADGVVYFCAGELAAYNADTGQELWRQPKVKSDMASAVLWKNNGRTFVLCAAPGRSVSCLDAANGAVLWQENVKGGYGSLAVSGDMMVSRTQDGSIAYRISPQKAEKMWTSPDGGDYGGSPIIYQDHVYMCGRAYTQDLLTVFDVKTGAVTLKQVGKGGECSIGTTSLCALPVLAFSDPKSHNSFILNGEHE